MATSIKISGLNNLAIITSDDYFPIVDSGSVTTYRASVTTLGNWMLASGSVSSSLVAISSSYSRSGSFAFRAISSSYATRSFLADTASYFNLITNIPPFALSSLSSSWATRSFSSTSSSFATTSSWSNRSKTSDSASYIIYSGFPNGTASYALNAGTSTSSSYAVTSSYAVKSTSSDTASFIATSGGGGGAIAGIAKAWATCMFTSSSPNNFVIGAAGSNWNHPAIVCGFNVSDITRTTQPFPNPFRNEPFTGEGTGRHWMVTLTDALPSTNYAVFGTTGGETNVGSLYVTMYPEAARTTTQFTLSLAHQPDASLGGGSAKRDWFSFVIFSNP